MALLLGIKSNEAAITEQARDTALGLVRAIKSEIDGNPAFEGIVHDLNIIRQSLEFTRLNSRKTTN